MGITRLAITRPLAILMFIIGLVLLGGYSYRLMRVDRMPAISVPFVSVGVSYSGAPPEDVEEFILKPIEASLAGLAGVQSISSSASEGRGNINLQLAEGANADQTAIDVERRMAAIRGRLPADAGVPTVNRMDPNSSPIMNIALSGPHSTEELYEMASEFLQPQLQSVLGVADVTVFGGRGREVRIEVDFTKLEAYGLTLQSLTAPLQRENVSTPAGTITEGRRTIPVRSLGLFRSADELNELIIGSTAGGPVYLRDVATVSQGYKEQQRIMRLNGKESVGLSVIKQSDANSLQVAEDVKRTVENARRVLPSDVSVTITNDAARFTRAALEAVQFDLVMAFFLCGLVLLLFLHTWRNTLIVVLAIPTSLISTFLVMWIFGFSLNTISLMALAMTIGILVDDSIVVLENIHRHLRMGEGPMFAALNGRNEIGLAAMAITFTDIVVYIPVAFMQENIGRMFKEYGLTIAAATLFSLLISFTLTPMLASRWLKHNEDNGGRGIWSRFTRGWERGYEGLASRYQGVIAWALRHRLVVVGIGLIFLGISYSFIPLNILATEYAPQEDDNQFNVSIQMPPGTSLKTAADAVLQVESAMTRIPEIEQMFTTVGGGGGGPGGGGRGGSIAVQVVNKNERQRSLQQITADVRRIASTIPEANVQAQVQNPLGGGGFGGGGAQIRIQGESLATLMDIAAHVEAAVRQVPGVVDMRNSANSSEPEIRAVLNRKRMAELGVTAQQVGTAMRTAISGSVGGQLRMEGQNQLDITVVSKDAARRTTADIANIPITSVNGVPVRLGQVATISWATGPVQISRTDRQRVITLSSVTTGRATSEVARDVREALNTVSVPPGYRVTLGGQVQQMERAINALLSALAFSVILIYMLMVALYESWVYPLAIMFSLPFALVGAFTALLVTGNTFNIFSMIGMIMLMGLVAKNGILLVDYINTLRKGGMPRNQAIVEAGRTRLRPILMTSATMVFAMMPLAMKFESGAESRSPMAVVIIGGIISSTLLTLLVVPVIYTYLDAVQEKLKLGRAPVRLRLDREPAPVAGWSDEGIR